MWLAAENGMFLRRTGEQWISTMSEHLEISWSESVKVHLHSELCSVISVSCCTILTHVDIFQKVFEYFRKRTPGSYHEERETSVLWNYKNAGKCLTYIQTQTKQYMFLILMQIFYRCSDWKKSSKGFVATFGIIFIIKSKC